MKRRLLLLLFFVAGIAVAIHYASVFLHTHALSLHFQSSRPAWVLCTLIGCAVTLQMLGNVLRAYKSRYLLDPIRQSTTPVLFRGLSIGYLFNALLPFRLGEVIRAFYLGDRLAISKTAALISIVIERIVDGFVLSFTLILTAVIIHPISSSASVMMIRFGLLVFLAALLLSLLIGLMQSENKWLLRLVYRFTDFFSIKIRDRMRFIAWSGIYGTRLMLSEQAYRKRYLTLSLGMWLVYFASTACVAVAFFSELDARRVWYIIQSTYVGVSAPAGPGYIGSFHLIVSELLEPLNLNNVGSFSLFAWFIIIVPTSLVGIYVLLLYRRASHNHTSRQDSLINKLRREADISSELSHFLDAYLQGEEINQILTHAELENKFKLIKSFKGGSNAHTMLVWQGEELRVKKITLAQYADKLSAQAQWLRERADLPHIPRVIAEERTPTYYSFDIDYLESYAPFFEFIHSNSSAANNQALGKVIAFMRTSIYKQGEPSNNTKNVEEYIDSKVLGKVQDTAAINSELNQLLGERRISINGKTYANLPQVVEKIKANAAAMQDLSSYSECVIHGDLTIDNLIVSPDADFLVIDPNNENQVSTPVVDYGKLYQSLHSGYEFLIQLESCAVSKASIQFEEAKSQKYAESFEFLDTKLQKELSDAEYKSILFHEAVHYCRMLTYRAHINPATLAVFYATAVRLFNNYLEQYDRN